MDSNHRKELAESEGFEPPRVLPLPAFQASAISLSAMTPFEQMADSEGLEPPRVLPLTLFESASARPKLGLAFQDLFLSTV